LSGTVDWLDGEDGSITSNEGVTYGFYVPDYKKLSLKKGMQVAFTIYENLYSIRVDQIKLPLSIIKGSKK